MGLLYMEVSSRQGRYGPCLDVFFDSLAVACAYICSYMNMNIWLFI